MELEVNQNKFKTKNYLRLVQIKIQINTIFSMGEYASPAFLYILINNVYTKQAPKAHAL